ncbi:MAG: hypothetical protein ACK5Q5_11660 [Planctomycetaceae bacterium]
MTKADKLLLRGDYEEALHAFESAAAKDQTDDFRIGDRMSVAITLVLLERREEAIARLGQLSNEAFASVSLHDIYIGVAHWYAGRPDAAVSAWEQARKRGYTGHQGCDSLFMLAFASAKQPDVVAWSHVQSLMTKRLKRVPDCYISFHICQFLIGSITRDVFREWCGRELNGRNIKARRENRLLLCDFYCAIDALRKGSLEEYVDLIRAVATRKGIDEISTEWVLARLELQALDH